MHVQFAYAAIIKATNGEASIGDAAYAVWPVIGATVAGSGHAARSGTVFAPFNQENEIQAFPGSELRVHPTPRCKAVAALSLRETSARTGAVLGGGAISSRACPAGHAALEIEGKILAGDGARAGKVAFSALHAGGRRVFRRANCASRGQHQEAGFAQDGEERLCTPVRLCFGEFHSECGLQRGAITLHDVRDGMRAVLDVVKM